MSSSSFVCVPISSEVYNELVIRKGEFEANLPAIIEQVVVDFLERTEKDGEWSDAYFDILKEQHRHQVLEKYGDPSKGYHWTSKGVSPGSVFLPNGTILRMRYYNEYHDARIDHEKIIYENNEYVSPSRLASQIADGTSRNAWRDFYIKRPGDSDWFEAISFKDG